LIQVTDRASVGGAPTQIIMYLYDVENRWIGEDIDGNGDGVVQHETRFVYDGNQIVLQFDKDFSGASGSSAGATGSASALTAADLSHRYLWGPAVDQILADEQLAPLPSQEGQGEGYNLQTPGTVVWPLTDNQGTVRDLAMCNQTTGTTTVVNHLVYSSYGQLLSQTNPATGNTAAVDCLFAYTGRATDKLTDIEFHGRRDKIAGSTDWMSEDPDVTGGGDTNFYRYCGNSPTSLTDPTGLKWTIDRNATKSRAEVVGQPGVTVAQLAAMLNLDTSNALSWLVPTDHKGPPPDSPTAPLTSTRYFSVPNVVFIGVGAMSWQAYHFVGDTPALMRLELASKGYKVVEWDYQQGTMPWTADLFTDLLNNGDLYGFVYFGHGYGPAKPFYGGLIWWIWGQPKSLGNPRIDGMFGSDTLVPLRDRSLGILAMDACYAGDGAWPAAASDAAKRAGTVYLTVGATFAGWHNSEMLQVAKASP
jgi:RHS repeat-associated protein